MVNKSKFGLKSEAGRLTSAYRYLITNISLYPEEI